MPKYNVYHYLAMYQDTDSNTRYIDGIVSFEDKIENYEDYTRLKSLIFDNFNIDESIKEITISSLSYLGKTVENVR